jgi:MFS family permease
MSALDFVFSLSIGVTLAIYLVGIFITIPFFCWIDKITGPHYGSGSSEDDRKGRIFLMSFFWLVCLPLTIFAMLLYPLFFLFQITIARFFHDQ